MLKRLADKAARYGGKAGRHTLRHNLFFRRHHKINKRYMIYTKYKNQLQIAPDMPARISDQSNSPPFLFCAISTAIMTRRVVIVEITRACGKLTLIVMQSNVMIIKIIAPNLACMCRLLSLYQSTSFLKNVDNLFIKQIVISLYAKLLRRYN